MEHVSTKTYIIPHTLLLSFSIFDTIAFLKGYRLQLQKNITRENLKTLMTLFYENAILHEELGPFFTDELGDDINDDEWIDHIDLLANFWLAQLLHEKTYVGNFIGAHIKLPHIKNELFAVWVKLFSSAADSVYEPEIASLFKEKGRELSQQFIRNNKNHSLKERYFRLKENDEYL